jgi:glycosyltransferase involved in cell wall biosynthesis
MDFVRVASGLCEARGDARFLYVGDGPMRDEVFAEAERLGVAGRISFLGVREDVPDLLRAMDIFILTSLWEGLPRVVLQALATGLPVVAYDTAGITEAVTEGVNGFTVAPGAVTDMVARLASLAGDRRSLDAMGRAAVENFDRAFTEDRMIAELERLYDELTAARRGGAGGSP